MEFSKDQKYAIDRIVDWYTSYTHKLQSFLVGGAAGVGKSTIVSHLRDFFPMARIHYCAYTGKATTVLRHKLAEIGIDSSRVSTIHSLMYNPILNSNKEIIGWERKQSSDIKADLIVCDEASMVPKEIYEDLTSYGIPILFVGDHAQLPPVSNFDFNLMNDPFVKLETPHRFAADSPIVKLATKVRNGESIKYGSYGDGVYKRRQKDVTPAIAANFFQSQQNMFGDAMLLCGFNKTRVKLNQKMRKQFGYENLINIGERVVCLRNNKKTNIPLYNGSLGTIKHVGTIHTKAFKGVVKMDGFEDHFRGVIYNDIFNSEKPELHKGRDRATQCFDYGYCLSVHKSQGSSWPTVVVFDEQCSLWDHDRWLYTAITRSEKELLIIKN